ncbi:hypothetical protein [Streptomyces sp. NPDC001515]
MQGLEVALLRLATTVLGTVARLCPEIRDLSPLAELPLTELTVNRLHPGLPAAQLEQFTELRQLFLGHRFPRVGRVGDLRTNPHLRSLNLIGDAEGLSLEGVGQWRELADLGLGSATQFRELCMMSDVPPLRRLTLDRLEDPDLSLLRGLPGLADLSLTRCRTSGGLAPLREMPALTRLHLFAPGDGVPYDLSPLADLDGLTVSLASSTPVTGAELLPPERLVRP